METKICRVCLQNTASISIFEEQDNIQYSTKIMKCANVVIEEGDGLPGAICMNCATEVYSSYEFVNKCEASDKVLRSVTLTDHSEEVLPKTEPEFKEEDIKQEILEDDSSHLDNYVLEDNIDSCDYDGEKPKRKYTKSLKFREGLARRKYKSKVTSVTCLECEYKAASRSALDSHMRIHTGEKPFVCHYCDAKFNLKGTLKRHILTHHTERERKFICETCGNSFLNKNSIITHMRVHTDERPYPCPFCSKTFRQVASMIRHKRMHTGERPYPCPVCAKKFPDKSHMVRHQVVHSDERKFTCQLCSKSVKTKNALTCHMRVHSNEKHNVCSYCGMTFSLKGNLQVHIKRIHSEKSGECLECRKTFSDLASHMNKHTGEKPFICKLCDQRFASKRSLSNHKGFKHENASKFKCSIGECTKTFPTAMMLEFHLLKHHTNHTPYICHHCSKGYFRTSDLSRHLRVSHMETIKVDGKGVVV